MQFCRQNYLQNCNAKKCAENLANLANLENLAEASSSEKQRAKLEELDKLEVLEALKVAGTLRVPSAKAICVTAHGMYLLHWSFTVPSTPSPSAYHPVKKSKISPSCELSAR
jgi:hypothetical protein